MAAYVLALPPLAEFARTGTRVRIFPGSATPALVAARTPFWIGYGFVPGGAVETLDPAAFDVAARFELDVDGDPVSLETEVRVEDGLPVWKVSVAQFGAGLQAGWHQFVGRWYDAGALVLTTDRWIEFVDG